MKIVIYAFAVIFQFIVIFSKARPVITISGGTILNCFNPQTTLTANSNGSVSFNWQCNFPFTNINSPSIQVNANPNSNALVSDSGNTNFES